jgi:hypothetical protein
MSFVERLAPLTAKIQEAVDACRGPGTEAKAGCWPDHDAAGILLTGPKVGASEYDHPLQILLRWNEELMKVYISADPAYRELKAIRVATRIPELLINIEKSQKVDFTNRAQQKAGVITIDMPEL